MVWFIFESLGFLRGSVLVMLLIWAIFILSISTVSSWAELRDLSKLTSEEQHFERQMLCTQSLRQISSIY